MNTKKYQTQQINYFSERDCVCAVSYTHLDVYKRQLWTKGCVSFMQCSVRDEAETTVLGDEAAHNHGQSDILIVSNKQKRKVTEVINKLPETIICREILTKIREQQKI